ncbi:MAG: Putative periplasmic or secreted lipoprotein [Proteiniphilum sp. 51_7]|jgi:predicted RNA binding protein YcfA (HicA-like mRNA interferase family)|nr:MAG: Putative periplasmic or secreted lipoprotein [Proteiniphilum sp. 51_7]
MKKIPRNITGYELIKILGKFGYQITRQTGSHIRLTTTENGIHHITVPNHNPLKIGTLSNILSDIANHFQISKKELLEKLF